MSGLDIAKTLVVAALCVVMAIVITVKESRDSWQKEAVDLGHAEWVIKDHEKGWNWREVGHEVKLDVKKPACDGKCCKCGKGEGK